MARDTLATFPRIIHEDGDFENRSQGGGHCFVSGAVSLSDTPRSSSWWRWIPLVKLLMLEKKLDEKYFFIMEKNYFENFDLKIFQNRKIEKSKSQNYQI